MSSLPLCLSQFLYRSLTSSFLFQVGLWVLQILSHISWFILDNQSDKWRRASSFSCLPSPLWYQLLPLSAAVSAGVTDGMKREASRYAMQKPKGREAIAVTHSWRRTPAALYPRGKDTGTHWVGCWVGPKAGLDSQATGKIVCIC
jgi:hypothetical protein